MFLKHSFKNVMAEMDEICMLCRGIFKCYASCLFFNFICYYVHLHVIIKIGKSETRPKKLIAQFIDHVLSF